MRSKYAYDKALAEIMRRSRQMAQKRSRRLNRALSQSAVVLTIALITAVVLLPEKTGTPVAADKTVFGAFILPQGSGGYVLSAVIAFCLGVVVTWLCCRKRREKQNDSENGGSDKENPTLSKEKTEEKNK